MTAPYAALIVATALALAVFGIGSWVWGFHIGSKGACRECRSAPCAGCDRLIASLARADAHRGELLAEKAPADVAGPAGLSLTETAEFAAITTEEQP